jgi:DNA-binding response OmpR family regulator
MSECWPQPESQERRGTLVPKAAIGVRVLLVSNDIQIIDVLCHSMEQMAMHVEVCSDFGSASRKLCHTKFEAVVADFTNAVDALELVKKTREMTSHRGAVVLAILSNGNEMPSAFQAGANFVLVRPLLPTILMRTLRASYPIMVRERRRYYRCPLQIPIRVSSPSRQEFVATSVNLSENGMAFASPMRLQVGEKLNLRLTLPGTEIRARIGSAVCWADDAGRVGLEFVQIPAALAEQLRSWLSDRLEECLPRQGSHLLKL